VVSLNWFSSLLGSPSHRKLSAQGHSPRHCLYLSVRPFPLVSGENFPPLYWNGIFNRGLAYTFLRFMSALFHLTQPRSLRSFPPPFIFFPFKEVLSQVETLAPLFLLSSEFPQQISSPPGIPSSLPQLSDQFSVRSLNFLPSFS